MTSLIEADAPTAWQDLEARVAKILDECGYDVEVQKNVRLARGDVKVDVWADDHSLPPNVVVIECKNWAASVTKGVVHGFRTVVGDSGANTGLLVSTAGFQAGATAAAEYSNVDLIDWSGFQELFAERWFRLYMAPQLHGEADPLVEYTEPINSRVSRKVAALSDEQGEQLESLREKHTPLAMAFIAMYMDIPGRSGEIPFPNLPLRSTLPERHADHIPDLVLDATALRPLLDALLAAYREAIGEFDEVFGERA